VGCTQGRWKTRGMNNSTYIICRLSLELGCNLHVLTHSKFKCEMIQKPKKKTFETKFNLTDQCRK
jgi:hypothetical protein